MRCLYVGAAGCEPLERALLGPGQEKTVADLNRARFRIASDFPI